MVILGVDPGIATTGYGVVERRGSALHALTYGVVRTSSKDPTPDRLAAIHNHILEMIERYEVEWLATERLFFARNERTAFAVGRTIGVVLLAAAARGILWSEYTPLQVKQAVVGYGSAEKQQVQYMVRQILNLPELPRPDDAADALAVAVCHAHMSLPDSALR